MRKALVVASVLALLGGCALAAVECNSLLNCKSCTDESHCETCPDGYVLDEKKVCRYDCASKFGANCPLCTESKCICPKGFEWDSSAGACTEVKECTDSDPAACSLCGVGYDLVNMEGKCSTCASVFGAGCQTCSESKCLTIADGYKQCGAVVVAADAECPTECSALFPGCSECVDDACAACADSAVLDSGSCKYKMPSCESGKVIVVNGALTCGNCQSFDENCYPNRCTGHGCTMCKTGFAVTAAGTCVNCSSTFPGCGLCQEDACTKCRSASHTLTPNGCLNQDPYVPPEESNAGLIAGIVIAALVLIVLLILAVYCIVTSTAKHGQIDPSLYEDDLEFKSVSVL